MKPHKATGSDGLPPRVLREAADELAEPLTHLIRMSIEEKTVPQKWKLGHIVPAPKRNNPTLDDLRPLSMLPVFSNILEQVVLKSIKTELIGLYGANQFGFRPSASTLHAHILTHDFITRTMDLPEFAGVAMISYDMSKAYDRLQHECLFKTLVDGKLPTNFIKWCADYLKKPQATGTNPS